jgi:hypothetical protein
MMFVLDDAELEEYADFDEEDYPRFSSSINVNEV